MINSKRSFDSTSHTFLMINKWWLIQLIVLVSQDSWTNQFLYHILSLHETNLGLLDHLMIGLFSRPQICSALLCSTLLLDCICFQFCVSSWVLVVQILFLWLYSKRLLVCLGAERSLCVRLESEKSCLKSLVSLGLWWSWMSFEVSRVLGRLVLVESKIGSSS